MSAEGAHPPLLLLFDIDGTLLRGASLEHGRALHEAMQEVYGVRTEGTVVEAPGRTDVEIARSILLKVGVSKRRIDERLGELREVSAEIYAAGVPADLSAKVTAGMPALLERLSGRADVRLSLVTGNFEAIARLKLRAAGLARFFPSGQGGFGSDSEDRTELPPIARARAGTRDAPHPRERTIVIGDTPRDIACARADGLRIVAIVTGPFPAEDVADADAVVADAQALSVELDRLLA
jgi:phosphoglycolate phosphatase